MAHKKVFFFPNWVDNSKISKISPDLDFIQSLGIPLDKKIFFYSGSIGEKQGIEILLYIAPKLFQVNQDIFFLISGAGPYKDKLQQIVCEESMNNIMFIDLQTVAKFNHLLNFVYCHLIIQKEEAADLLLPSKLTNILAVGGLSIITANAGTTLYEVVNKYQMGVVVPPNDELAFYNAILNLANSNILDDGFFNIKQVKLAALNYANQFLKKDFIIDRFLETISI